jgi:hypothetical protein
MNLSGTDDRSTNTTNSHTADYVNGIDLEQLAVAQLPEGWYVLAMHESDTHLPDWTNAKFCGRPFQTCNDVDNSPTRGFGPSLDSNCAYCMHFQNCFMPILFSYGYPDVCHNLVHWGGACDREHHAYLIGPVSDNESGKVMRLVKKMVANDNFHYHFQPAGLSFWSDEDGHDECANPIASVGVTP